VVKVFGSGPLIKTKVCKLKNNNNNIHTHTHKKNTLKHAQDYM